MKIALAFDIERSGGTNKHDTIAIGASVLDEDFNELDSLFLPGYVSGETQFEPRCWEEFWSKNTDVLNIIKYTGNLSYSDRQKEMIEAFQAFRCKWEELCESNGHELILVSDNAVYDGGFINQMIFTHIPDTLPIPYSAKKQKYKPFRETNSILRGILFVADPDYTSQFGLSRRIAEIYDVPTPIAKHDHNPANDAYTIAYDFQVANAIAKGTIVLRKNISKKQEQ